ncbi:cell growth regulator with RING finger domain protein 1 [Salarias fasciatus]|uniref:RING-type domain-containing protein n=1 Tax=Salarias fasciatus TaxID=181472 RepID=A0A672FIK5_SALFA|nr:cell growth regulator with RING finger domain protein 1 [Salarias fasciatus]
MAADMEMFYGLCCFGVIVAVVLVLMWFGFDPPRILGNPDDTELVVPIPEKQMVRVENPFFLELGSRPASVPGGVSIRPSCLEPSVLTCFWGCEVGALQEALLAHQHGATLRSARLFQDALRLRCSYCQTFHVGSEDREELHTQIPADRGVRDFGPPPRGRYPLVAVLTFGDSEDGGSYNIVASVTVVHVPDDKHNIPARILFEYLLTSQGNVHKLMSIFMAADGSEASEPPDPQPGSRPGGQMEGGGGRVDEAVGDCVVCRGAPVNRVLLPCRHACVCDGCMLHFQHCPVCRAFVLESFALTRPGAAAR